MLPGGYTLFQSPLTDEQGEPSSELVFVFKTVFLKYGLSFVLAPRGGED